MRHLALGLICACADQSPTSPSQQSLSAAADEAGVPIDLVVAIAVEEGGVKLPALRVVRHDDPVPVAGALELRHGRLDTLALGAKLLGTTEEALRADTDLGTRAGALVLSKLGAEHGAGDDLASWRRAIEVMSGMDDANATAYANRVFALLRSGGTFPARKGETVTLGAHDIPEVDSPAFLVAPEADYAGAIWFQTSCNDKCTPGRPYGMDAVDKIVIHDTEGGWDGSVATLQYDPNKSVHYIIDADGSRVGQFRPETDTTWHGGNFFYNATSIGIEHVGVASDPDGYSTELYAASRALVQDIRTRWNVPVDREHIIGHYQIPDGSVIDEQSPPCMAHLDVCENSAEFGGHSNHRDPGYYWQWCQYMQGLGGSCTCSDAWENWNCTTDKTQAVRCQNGVVEIADCTAGCDVMPIGTPDVCNVAPEDPDDDVGGGGENGGGGLDPTLQDPPEQGGCTTGGGHGIGLVVGILLILRRRRD